MATISRLRLSDSDVFEAFQRPKCKLPTSLSCGLPWCSRETHKSAASVQFRDVSPVSPWVSGELCPQVSFACMGGLESLVEAFASCFLQDVGKIHPAFVVCILRLYQSSCEFQDWRTDISLAWDRSCGLGLTCFEAASIASRLGSILWVEVSIVRTAPKYVAAVKARVFCPSDSIRL